MRYSPNVQPAGLSPRFEMKKDARIANEGAKRLPILTSTWAKASS